MFKTNFKTQSNWNKLVTFKYGTVDCGLNFKRVFAGHTTLEETKDGSVFLNSREGINNGKTFAWFEYASTTEADYVFKMDTDTAINPVGVHMIILDAAIKKSDYIGFAMTSYTCGYYKHCPGKKWTYMSGAFYGIKNTISKQIVNNAWVKNNKNGIEDLMVGRWIYKVIQNVKIYNITCLAAKNVSCPIKHFQKNKTIAGKKWLDYGRRLLSKTTTLSFFCGGGLANQIISFQKTACRSYYTNMKILKPTASLSEYP